MPRKSKFATKHDIEKINKRMRLNEWDNILLSVATSLGIFFSVIQIFKSSWEVFLPSILLLALGFGMPLVNYINRVRRKLRLHESLIGHFDSWIYFSFAIIGYIIISLVSLRIIESNVVIAALSIILFFGTVWILNNRATRFFKSFGYKRPHWYPTVIVKGYNVFLKMVLLYFAYILFYSGYILQQYQPEVTPLLYIFGILLLLMILLSPIIGSAIERLTRFIVGKFKKMISKRQKISRLKSISKGLKPRSKMAGSKRRKRRFLFLLLCTIAILSICTSFVLAGIINSFFKRVLGEDVGARIEAPIVEELLKPLSLVILAAMFSLANRKRLVKINWLRSMKVDYAIGYASGLTVGVLESGITYGTFSGVRAITPFFHAFNTGLVGIGICYVLTGGKKGLTKLIPLYLLAVLLHSTWNSIGSQAVLAVFGLSMMIIGLIVLPQLLMKRGRRPAPR
jgi:hypothetical protein